MRQMDGFCWPGSDRGSAYGPGTLLAVVHANVGAIFIVSHLLLILFY
jgi:hypothetical protein